MNFTKLPQYSEPLKSGGELIVTKTFWKISYYFQGPDLRHNGEFINIPSSQIDKYIDAYKTNFDKYEELKMVLPKDGSFTTVGACNMNIAVGKWANGVSIAQFYNHLSESCFPIKTRSQLEMIINDYNYCKSRASEIKSLIYS